MRVIDFRLKNARLVGRYRSKFRIVSNEIAGRPSVDKLHVPWAERVRWQTSRNDTPLVHGCQRAWVGADWKREQKATAVRTDCSLEEREWHEAGSQKGMTVIVVEYKDL